MSQHTFSISNEAGAAFRGDVNSALQALASQNSGAAGPATTYAYQAWMDTTASLKKRRNAANSAWLIEGSLDETYVIARSSNTILAGSDRGKTFVCTSTFTQTLTAAATLADGWWCEYRNDGVGIITLDPNASETIDGATTMKLNPGEAVVINCNGSAFSTIGIGLVRGLSTLFDNLTISCSAAANALTIALKNRNGDDPTSANPIRIPIRNATAATGDYTEMLISAATSLVLSNGSTLGTVANIANRIWIIGFNDAGTFRLGAINCLSTAAGAGAGRDVTGIYPLRGWGIASSTAEGGAGAADSAQVFYTGSAVAAKPYIVLGYLTYEAGLGTAGVYASAPTRVQIFGPDIPLPGDVLQVQRNDTGAVVTGSTVIPIDDTIPQNTEGDQYMSQAITPSSAANILDVEAQAHLANSTVGALNLIGALFQDAVANALKATEVDESAANLPAKVILKHSMLAAVTTTVTFKFRGGAGGNTTTFNGAAGTRRFGGVLNSFMEVKEVMA